MQAESNVSHLVGGDLNVMVYMFGGSAKINGKLVEDGQLALLSQGSEIELVSDQGAEFLVLAGPEINEPIARYGPFVMNTRQEINQAIMDYQNGTLA
jgi:redox-sensitive bicupin YhaK (pirin superfamily)